jgi:hypothetical protein
MKKKILYLMIACLSLIAYPGIVKADTEASAITKTETVIDPGAIQSLKSRMHEQKVPHSLFHKKNETGSESTTKKDGGYTVVYISGAGLLLILILLIILL